MSGFYHLGINLGHERSAAIVHQGKLEVAIEQERLDRNKFSLGYLLQSAGNPEQMQIPLEAIRYCLDACKIGLSDIASITANMPGVDVAPQILQRSLPPELCDRIQTLPSHHLGHAYSAYAPSGFEEALIWVADASGSTKNHRTESYSLFLGQGTNITPLHSETVEAHLSGISTLGFLYEYITKEAGFVTQVGNHIKHAEAGKLMGLAPFGGPQPNWHQWIHTKPGSYHLELSPYDIFLEVEAIKKTYGAQEEKPYLRAHIVDLAYKVQTELEQAIIHLIAVAKERTGINHLCIAGGVGLNSVANYKVLQTLAFDDIFVFPAAGDSGIAAGCAYWAYHTVEQGQQRVPLGQANLGQTYSNQAIEEAIQTYSEQIRVQTLSDDDIIERTASVLAKGSIVARYEGGAEFGPRALGQRSIIADPTFLKMKDIINARVKFREAFRPFAPVIPLESMDEVFEQEVAAPFMLLVAKIKEEYQSKIPAVTHVDGTGRVQSVTAEHNPFFYELCHRLVAKRSGPPVLLNTSFNVAGQPIVETPAEAIATFLTTDIDFLAIGNYWLSKQHVCILNYEDHLSKVHPTPTPKGLDSTAPEMTELMRKLDQAMFFDQAIHCPWSPEEVQTLASKIGQYKETSRLFPDHPYSEALQTRLSDDVILLLNPQGNSSLVHLHQKELIQQYSHDEVKLLLAYLQQNIRDIEHIRIKTRQTQHEFQSSLQWAQDQLGQFGLKPELTIVPTQMPDSPIGTYVSETFAPFESSDFSSRKILGQFYNVLKKHSYNTSKICDRLQLKTLQEIQPTHLHYYDQYQLCQDELSDFIRLFQLRGALPLTKLVSLFGEEIFTRLCQIGLFIPRRELWASRVDIFDVEGLLIATDHRYMLMDEDQYFKESPVMYIGMDSMGLVHTAPQYECETLLDLCCGSGIQGLFASRYTRHVVGVDINPRALRFSRFNAQLNGIDNIEFRVGSLYEAVDGEKFNTILANPPFVPSPNRDFKFRDGGSNGEEILASIVRGSHQHLCPRGRLHIVTDLVDVEHYAEKLQLWWEGEGVDQLVLGTADRNDILFSVPHSHAAFGQSYNNYCQELEEWLNNFHSAELKAVNFGYILLQRNPGLKQAHYHFRTIHNPSSSIHSSVEHHFRQRQRLESPQQFKLKLNPDISIRQEWNQGERNIEIFSSNNSYFTTYPINDRVLMILEEIQGMNPDWQDYVNLTNQAFIEELVLKGILELSDEACPSIGAIQHPWNTWNPATLHTQQPAPKVAKELTIEELQTKTTPTCLSSYL